MIENFIICAGAAAARHAPPPSPAEHHNLVIFPLKAQLVVAEPHAYYINPALKIITKFGIPSQYPRTKVKHQQVETRREQN
jgi:hypothetical protein